MNQRTTYNTTILLGVTVLLLGACAHSKTSQTPAPAVCPTVQCNITQTVWNHISGGHCPPATCPPKSIFEPQHCTDLAAGVAFCNSIVAAANCMETVQPNGRIKATATLATVVGSDRNNGCMPTMTGTVIYNPSTNQVVTQFPGQ